MGQNYDPFHVPQQNRRNKLRVNTFQTTQPQQQQQQPQFLIMNNNNSSTDPLQQGLSLSLSFQLVDNGQRSYNGFSVPLGPFTGYASILKNSKFLKPAQQLFDDLFGPVNCDLLDFLTEPPHPHHLLVADNFAFTHDSLHKLQFKDSKLIFLLDQVYKKYKVYCQQMQRVVASFETVGGLGNAAPYICYAIKTVSKHFTCLKNALLNQIHFTNNSNSNSNDHKSHHHLHDQKPTTMVGLSDNYLQHPVWRSQRGLPDHAVSLLKTWLFEHFLHPYPSDSEKQILSEQTGLSRTQVSNWFINARVRLWKPMVEEVYKLSSQQPQSSLEPAVNQNTNNNFISSQLYADNIKHKRSRNEIAAADDDHIMSSGQQEDRNLVCLDSLTSHYQTGISGTNDVCLALGLHQNNYVTPTTATLPINIAHHVNTLQMFGFMDSASAASFQSQSLNFGKE